MGNFIDLTGQEFGRIKVLQRAPNDGERIMWLCKCNCGNEIVIDGKHLKCGYTKSCGCLRREKRQTHAMSKTRLYKIWCGMKTRCCNPKNERYKDYGARGITICDEWINDFYEFYKWANRNGYEEHLTIDRIDVNGNYSPENCRWVSLAEQNRNRRNTVLLSHNGITQTMQWWANKLNMYPATISKRYHKGWSDEECLFGKEGNNVCVSKNFGN